MPESDQVNGQSTDQVDNVTTDPAPDNTVGAAVDAIVNGVTDGDGDGGGDRQTPPADDTDNQPQNRQNQRDYSGLSDEERDMFQRMSNRGYQKLYPLYLESRNWQTWKTEKENLQKQLEELRNSSFYEDENAYQVTPEYQQLSQTVSKLSGEAEFWKEQLANIENGQPFSYLHQDPNGQITVKGPVTEYNQGSARAQIIGALTNANALMQNYSAQLNSYSQKYKTGYESAKKSLQDVEAKIFAGADMKKLDAEAEKKLKMFPSSIRSIPVKTAARLLVVLDGLIAMNRRANGSQVTQRIKSNIAQAAGPSGSAINTGMPKGKTVGDVMSEFQKGRALGQL